MKLLTKFLSLLLLGLSFQAVAGYTQNFNLHLKTANELYPTQIENICLRTSGFFNSSICGNNHKKFSNGPKMWQLSFRYNNFTLGYDESCRKFMAYQSSPAGSGTLDIFATFQVEQLKNLYVYSLVDCSKKWTPAAIKPKLSSKPQ